MGENGENGEPQGLIISSLSKTSVNLKRKMGSVREA
jgi:hypothetical protein